MGQAPTQSLSLSEFLALPETKPASEYMGGEIVQKTMPQGKHSILQRELMFALTLVFRTENVAQAFPELRCTFGDRSIVPDIAIFRSERIPIDDSGEISNSFNHPPDWTIEILSPGQSHTRVIRNILHCLNHGTEMGWLLDPEEAVVFIYQSDNTVRAFENTSLRLPTPIFAEAVQLQVSEIFNWMNIAG